MLRTRRSHDPAHAFPFFGLFWVGAGVGLVTDAALTAMALSGGLGTLALPLLQLKVLATLLGILGIVHYLLYIYTGRPGLLKYLLGGFVVLIALAEFTLAQSGPLGVQVDTWRAWYDFRQAPQGPAFLATVALAFAPPLVLCGAYARLLLLLDDPASRWRGAWLTAGLTAFFVAYTLAALFAALDEVVLLQKVLNVAAAMAATLAVHPPRWARERFGARALGEPVAPAEVAA